MEALNPRRYSVLTMLQIFSAYLLARLRANTVLADLVTVAQQAHDALYAAWQTWWAEGQARQAAVSVRDVAVYRLDAALRNVRSAVQGATHNDRLSTIYLALFPNGYDDIIRHNPADKIVLVRKMLSLLANFNDPDLISQTAALQDAADAYDKDAAALDEALKVRQAADAALEVARQAYCVHYIEIYHRVAVALGSNKLADTYFRSTYRKVAGTVPDPSQPSTPTEPVSPVQPAVPTASTTPVLPPVPSSSAMPVLPTVPMSPTVSAPTAMPAPAIVPTPPVTSPQPAPSTNPAVPRAPASGQSAASNGPAVAGESNADKGRRAA